MSFAHALSLRHLHIRLFAVVFALMMLLAVMPAPAHAATGLTETQKSAVISLLASFGADDATLSNVKIALNGGTASDMELPEAKDAIEGTAILKVPAPNCAELARTLTRGDQGDDVAKLQNFLQEHGYLSASSTGYFGPLTEKAIKDFQEEKGIVSGGDSESTGLGVAGPQTRAQIEAQCKQFQQSSAGAPTCTLTAEKNNIEKGEVVVLKWEGENALYASSATGGKGPVVGSIQVKPEQTTTYVKRVYNSGGEGACTTTITVDGTVASPDAHVVATPGSVNVANVLSAMGTGAGVLWEQYLNLFRF